MTIKTPITVNLSGDEITVALLNFIGKRYPDFEDLNGKYKVIVFDIINRNELLPNHIKIEVTKIGGTQ